MAKNDKQQTVPDYKKRETFLNVDFEDLGQFTATRPLTLIYRDKTKAEKTWGYLYADFCHCFYNDFPNVFMLLYDNCVEHKETGVVAKEENIFWLTSPIRLAQGFYIEVAQTPRRMLQIIKWLLDHSPLDYNDVVIRYAAESLLSNMGDNALTQEEPNRKKPPRPRYVRPDKQAFFNWLVEKQKFSPYMGSEYVRLVRDAEKIARGLELKPSRLYTENTAEAYQTVKLLLNSDISKKVQKALYYLVNYYRETRKVSLSPSERMKEPKAIPETSNKDNGERPGQCQMMATYYISGQTEEQTFIQKPITSGRKEPTPQTEKIENDQPALKPVMHEEEKQTRPEHTPETAQRTISATEPDSIQETELDNGKAAEVKDSSTEQQLKPEKPEEQTKPDSQTALTQPKLSSIQETFSPRTNQPEKTHPYHLPINSQDKTRLIKLIRKSKIPFQQYIFESIRRWFLGKPPIKNIKHKPEDHFNAFITCRLTNTQRNQLTLYAGRHSLTVSGLLRGILFGTIKSPNKTPLNKTYTPFIRKEPLPTNEERQTESGKTEAPMPADAEDATADHIIKQDCVPEPERKPKHYVMSSLTDTHDQTEDTSRTETIDQTEENNNHEETALTEDNQDKIDAIFQPEEKPLSYNEQQIRHAFHDKKEENRDYLMLSIPTYANEKILLTDAAKFHNCSLKAQIHAILESKLLNPPKKKKPKYTIPKCETTVQCRFTSPQIDILKMAAKEQNVSLMSFVRFLLFENDYDPGQHAEPKPLTRSRVVSKTRAVNRPVKTTETKLVNMRLGSLDKARLQREAERLGETFQQFALEAIKRRLRGEPPRKKMRIKVRKDFDAVITCRLTTAQKRRVAAAAKAERITVSKFILGACFGNY